MTKSATVLRLFALAAFALCCGTTSGLVALWVQGKLLRPHDGAHGMSVWEMLSDPLVRLVWNPVVLWTSFLGFMLSLWGLWRARLAKALPLVMAITVAAVAITSVASSLLAAPMGLVAGAVTIGWCRHRDGWSIPWTKPTLSEIEAYGGRSRRRRAA